MDNTLKTHLDAVKESLIETYELALAYGDGDTKNSAEYQKIFEEILKVENNATRCEKALEKAKEQSTVEDVQSAYSSEIQKNKSAFQAKKTKEYNAFQKRLEQIKETFDMNANTEASSSNVNRVESDEFVMETQVNVIDPLTKCRMENPVKNKICGHHYEKSSILEAIRINRRIRCAVSGCGNKQPIKPEHLVADDALKAHIMNMNDEESDDEDPLAM